MLITEKEMDRLTDIIAEACRAYGNMDTSVWEATNEAIKKIEEELIDK